MSSMLSMLSILSTFNRDRVLKPHLENSLSLRIYSNVKDIGCADLKDLSRSFKIAVS
jgi:hypothetical protein